MRMRRKKNGAARLEACAELLLSRPEQPIASAREVFGREGEIFLEVGAGKGGFACETARQNPDALFFAMERISDCVVLAAEQAKARAAERPDNLRFLVDGADSLPLWFAPGAVSRMYLNFSDPWHKKGYRKRRLTYRRYLAMYFTLLRDGGILRFKTDNVPLFEFSLGEIAALGLTPAVVTRDLHASAYAEGNVMTEYERAFTEKGVPICMLEVKKPEGYVPHYEEERKASDTSEEDTSEKGTAGTERES